MHAKHAKWRSIDLPRLEQGRVSKAVREIGRLLSVPEGIWEGPVAKQVLSYDDVQLYRQDRLSMDFLRKYPGFTWGNPREAAITEFWRCEEQNAETNRRLRAAFESGVDPHDNLRYIRTAACLISEWLPRFSWPALIPKGKWGPGVTSSTKGARLHAANKFHAEPEVSPAFAKTGMQLISCCPSWADTITGVDFPTWVTPLPKVVPGNRITFVPKDATTDRAIAVEPHVNIFFQLGAGTWLREILLTRGLDLNDQKPNQDMAKLGSKDDSLSTLDLKSASNTLSYRTVMYLLPPDWFAALDRLRSQFGTLDGKKFSYQMFSSMGNGFTFELESMIFYALCLSVAQWHGYNPFWVRAYGDDLVVPKGIADEVIKVLTFAGFSVNLAKSHISGPFRESCGKDYLRGSLVRPVYLKEVPDNPLAWIKIANNIKRLASVWGEGKSLDLRLKPAYDFALSMIPPSLRRLSCPDGFGDVALIRDFDEARPDKAPGGWEGWVTSVILTRPKKFDFNDRSLITAGSHKPGQGGNNLPYRDAVEHAIGPMFFAVWRNMGPWR